MKIALKAIWEENDAEFILTEMTNSEELYKGMERFTKRLYAHLFNSHRNTPDRKED